MDHQAADSLDDLADLFTSMLMLTPPAAEEPADAQEVDVDGPTGRAMRRWVARRRPHRARPMRPGNAALDGETDVDDVSIAHDVIPSLHRHAPRLTGVGGRAGGDEILPG